MTTDSSTGAAASGDDDAGWVAETVAYLNGLDTKPSKAMADACLRMLNRGFALRAEVERLQGEIDWIAAQPADDRMFAEIEAAARASFRRHKSSVRGQILTRSDSIESHTVWAALSWAESRARERVENAEADARHMYESYTSAQTRAERAEAEAESLRGALRIVKNHVAGLYEWPAGDGRSVEEVVDAAMAGEVGYV